MTLTQTLSMAYKEDLLADHATDSVVIVLTNGLSFDPSTHVDLDDITSYQLPTGNGYTQDSLAVVFQRFVRDEAAQKVTAEYDNVMITAEGGSLGPFDGVTFINVTKSNRIMAHIASDEPITITDGLSRLIPTPDFNLVPE